MKDPSSNLKTAIFLPNAVRKKKRDVNRNQSDLSSRWYYLANGGCEEVGYGECGAEPGPCGYGWPPTPAFAGGLNGICTFVPEKGDNWGPPGVIGWLWGEAEWRPANMVLNGDWMPGVLGDGCPLRGECMSYCREKKKLIKIIHACLNVESTVYPAIWCS